MAEPLDVRVAADDADREAAYAVRQRVFVDEQQVPADVERDAADDTAVHVVAFRSGRAVGAGRLVVHGASGRIGRMAVDPDERGRGVGRAVLDELEQAARRAGLTVVELHAQEHAAGFYLGTGYTAYGDPFLEAGIRHVAMRKRL